MTILAGSTVLAVAPDTDAATALQLMRAYRLRHLPVVDGRRCVGLLTETGLGRIVTTTDVLAELAGTASEGTEGPP